VGGGQSRKIAQQFLGEVLAVRCERSEHGKSQQNIKHAVPFSPFLDFPCHIDSIFLLLLMLPLHSPPLACNEAAAWGSGGFHHCSCGLLDRKDKQNFERDKAAIAPNCLLAARRTGQQKNILKI